MIARGRYTVSSREERPNGVLVTLIPVHDDPTADDECGVDGQLLLCAENINHCAPFTPGREFYVDITPAAEPAEQQPQT